MKKVRKFDAGGMASSSPQPAFTQFGATPPAFGSGMVGGMANSTDTGVGGVRAAPTPAMAQAPAMTPTAPTQAMRKGGTVKKLAKGGTVKKPMSAGMYKAITAEESKKDNYGKFSRAPLRFDADAGLNAASLAASVIPAGKGLKMAGAAFKAAKVRRQAAKVDQLRKRINIEIEKPIRRGGISSPHPATGFKEEFYPTQGHDYYPGPLNRIQGKKIVKKIERDSDMDRVLNDPRATKGIDRRASRYRSDAVPRDSQFENPELRGIAKRLMDTNVLKAGKKPAKEVFKDITGTYKKGGTVKKFSKGGAVTSRGDGCCSKGKTKGRVC